MVRWVCSLPKEELARVLPRMDVGMMILKNLPVFYYGTSPGCHGWKSRVGFLPRADSTAAMR